MDSSQQEDDPCYTCGSANSKEFICSCSKCGDRQHRWCMIPMLLDIPSQWFCHECQMKDSSLAPTQVRDDVSVVIPQNQHKRMNEPKSGKVKFLPASEAAGLLPGDARNCLFPGPISVRKRSPRHGKNIPSSLRISSPLKPSAPVQDFCQLMETRRENKEYKGAGKKTFGTVKPFTHQVSPIIPGGGSYEMEFKGREHKVKPKDLAIIEKFTKNPVNTDAIWSGQIEILDDPDHGIYCGLHAYLPRWVHIKTYYFSLSLPSLLSFKLISRNMSCDDFKDCPPDENCVALYMLPEFSDRKPYQHLMDMLDSSDYAMHTYIDGVELIVYTSKWLTMTCEDSEGQNFLWGLYRVRECSIGIHPNAQEEKVEESNIPIMIDGEEMNIVQDMQLDVVDGEGTEPQKNFVLSECKPSDREETRKAVKVELLEFPPGFESWWKKRKA